MCSPSTIRQEDDPEVLRQHLIGDVRLLLGDFDRMIELCPIRTLEQIEQSFLAFLNERTAGLLVNPLGDSAGETGDNGDGT